MAVLTTSRGEVSNIFQLIGTKEDDITKSISWALANCPVFLNNVLQDLLKINIDAEDVIIKFQTSEKDKGRTDLEITDDVNFHIIIEAKRGWNLPGYDQLNLYSQRESLRKSKAKHKILVTMSECCDSFAKISLPGDNINGIPLLHLSWKRICRIAEQSRVGSNHAEKRLLDELVDYLGVVGTMQNKESNWVYVVSLGAGYPEKCSLSWRDIVNKRGMYFHPVGNHWPEVPPNYIAFRYDGELKSIHHIDDFIVTQNLHEDIPEMPDNVEKQKYYIYKLGPAIYPPKKTPNGPKVLMSARRWAMLDLLLTANTITEACIETDKRMQQN